MCGGLGFDPTKTKAFQAQSREELESMLGDPTGDTNRRQRRQILVANIKHRSETQQSAIADRKSEALKLAEAKRKGKQSTIVAGETTAARTQTGQRSILG